MRVRREKEREGEKERERQAQSWRENRRPATLSLPNALYVKEV